ncbi:MAG: type II secretion system F family protein [Chthonomonadales bacterium]|nr:type II secretion system F family protein [Chthonomonadales bacterium]
MPTFEYTARNTAGQLVSDAITYSDEVALRQYLRSNDLYVLEVREKRQKRTGTKRSVGLADIILFTRHLRTMLMAGMPLLNALEALAEQSGSARLSEVIDSVARSVATGKPLATAMGQYPTVFPELLITMTHAGEESGRLPDTLQEASRQLELQMEIRQKLISAMMYPAFTLFATVLTVTAMLVFIVPVFANIYRELKAPLPAITQLLINISDILVHQGWIVLLILIAAGAFLRRYYKTPEGRVHIDSIKLKVPMVGNLVRKSSSANLTSALAGLLDSGVPLIQALQTASRVCGNEVMAEAARSAAHNLALGRKLSSELERSGHFPPMVCRMVAMAEEVGAMPEVLRQVAAGYIEEVEYAIRRVMTIIEPIMVLTVGAIVGFVLVAMYYPIFNMGNVFLSGA